MPVRPTDKDVYVLANVGGRDHRWNLYRQIHCNDEARRNDEDRHGGFRSRRGKQPSPYPLPEGEGACDSTAVRERFERRNPNHEKKSTRPLSSFELQDFFRHSPAAPHRNAA